MNESPELKPCQCIFCVEHRRAPITEQPIAQEGETPITDAGIFWRDNTECSGPDTSRKLERDLAALRQQLADVTKERDDAGFSKLRELAEIIRESKGGKWRIILDYDNYQDGSKILDGDGELLGACYELPPEGMDPEDGTAWQFSKALEQAQSAAGIHPPNSQPCAGNGEQRKTL